MAVTAKKISCSLPSVMIEDLDLIARSFGVTRSALLTQLLEESVVGLKAICEQHILPLEGGSADKKQTERAVRETLDRLADQIGEARSAYDKSIRH